MAATGFTPVQIYSSSTGGNTPAAGSLTNSTLGSELAINITDGYLFYKDNANVVQKIGIKNPATTSGTLAQFASTTSAQLAGVISDETGSGSLVFATSPSLTTPNIGAATGTSLTATGVIKAGYATGFYVDNSGTMLGRLYYSGGLVLDRASGTKLYVQENGSTQLRIDETTGNVNVSVGNVVIGTSGKGIDFSVTSQAAGMTSELLADYEEGTWTPTIQGTTSAGTGTYSVQNGKYTKIGNRVCVSAYIVWTAHTGTGNMVVGNLPYVVNDNSYPAIALRPGNIALTALNVMCGYCNDAANTVSLIQYPVGGGPTSAVAMDTDASLFFSATYTN